MTTREIIGRTSGGSLAGVFILAAAVAAFAAGPLGIAPPNDNFANAQVLNGTGGLVYGTNVEAGAETDEPLYNGVNKTVWYRWTAPANLSMTVETVDPATTLTDTVIGIFTGGSVGSLTRVGAWADDINGALNRRSRKTFIATAGTVYRIQVSGFTDATGTFGLTWGINTAESSKQFNFDGSTGSTRSDWGVFRPSNGTWYIDDLFFGQQTVTQQWGVSTDKLVPADYDGDGSTDIAVWRGSEGTFYILNSRDASFSVIPWGLANDSPVIGDFDGDDKADAAVWRASTGTFYVRNSAQPATFTAQPWGQFGDSLACGDYDGDGKTDFGIQRPGSGLGTFYVLRSGDGSFMAQQFGFSSDLVVPGDFDGDGKNDIAVYRTAGSTFYMLGSQSSAFTAIQWGASGDVVVPGNYGGVGTRSDLCVWRPSTGVFYCYADGGTANIVTYQWGQTGDFPIATSNVH